MVDLVSDFRCVNTELPYGKGYDAFNAYVEIWQNPYPNYSEDAIEWENGWKDAAYTYEQYAEIKAEDSFYDEDEFDDADGDYDATEDEDT